MSETLPTEAATVANKAPLEDLMAAMDVVDTLRHQRDIAERELDGEGRRDRLLERLRSLYEAQGIEVPDHVLQEGIDALEQERFQYHPAAPSWRTKIANMWVSRGRWGKPMGFLAVLGSLFSGVYFVSDVLPERQLKSGLPKAIEASLSTIRASAKNPAIIDDAQLRADAAKQALSDDDLDAAQQIQSELEYVKKSLQQSYSIRVISKPGESSGVWRVPDVNQKSRNYYLIVEAINSANKVVELEILNEETNKRGLAKTWGIRVNEETFYKVAADKQDDGIIQTNKVGEKLVGYLKPKFSIPTTGGTITKWK